MVYPIYPSQLSGQPPFAINLQASQGAPVISGVGTPFPTGFNPTFPPGIQNTLQAQYNPFTNSGQFWGSGNTWAGFPSFGPRVDGYLLSPNGAAGPLWNGHRLYDLPTGSNAVTGALNALDDTVDLIAQWTGANNGLAPYPNNLTYPPAYVTNPPFVG